MIFILTDAGTSSNVRSPIALHLLPSASLKSFHVEDPKVLLELVIVTYELPDSVTIKDIGLPGAE